VLGRRFIPHDFERAATERSNQLADLNVLLDQAYHREITMHGQASTLFAGMWAEKSLEG
jgi:hypothetical protein